MKKFLLAIASVAIMASCSNDAEQTTMNETTTAAEARNKSGATLEVLYDNMINSQSYINYKTALNDFKNQLNFDGDVTDVDTETKLLTWIRNNITTTNFTDIDEANNEWDSIKALGLISLNDNRLFYETLQDQEAYEEFRELISEVPSSAGCTEECDAVLADCTYWNDAALEGAIQTAQASWISPDINSTNQFNTASAVAIFNHILGEDVCYEDYATCCSK